MFRFRFPWLLATIASGTLCALLSARFETTLARSIVIAFFLTMVLGLNESLSIQAMSVTSKPCALPVHQIGGISEHHAADA